jgi:hypothetical protein
MRKLSCKSNFLISDTFLQNKFYNYLIRRIKMAPYIFDGQCLKSRFGYQIGEIEGNTIKDAHYNRVGEIDGNIIKDADYNKIAEVENGEIKDAHYKKIWTTEGVHDIIDGPDGLSSVAMWVLLLR